MSQVHRAREIGPQRPLGLDDGGVFGPGPPGPRRLVRPGSTGRARRQPATAMTRMGRRADGADGAGPADPLEREAREEREEGFLAPGATRAVGGGERARAEEPDPWRTCFERDRDRILHATSFRRLAGKTQVFVFPQDHQRTRLTHALEVAQVATAIARACRLNVALTEAIALGHDCGHGPGGHASEDALDPFLPGGFDHAPWGAHVSLAPLNLCAQTVDGIANHSWSRPAPSTPGGRGGQLGRPGGLRLPRLGGRRPDRHRVAPSTPPARARRLRGAAQRPAGRVHPRRRGRHPAHAARWAWRRTRPKHCRPSAPATTSASTCARPRCARARRSSTSCGRWSSTSPTGPTSWPTRAGTRQPDVLAGSQQALVAAVTYVAGMTDRFAFRQAVALLGWDPEKLPAGVGS